MFAHHLPSGYLTGIAPLDDRKSAHIVSSPHSTIIYLTYLYIHSKSSYCSIIVFRSSNIPLYTFMWTESNKLYACFCLCICKRWPSLLHALHLSVFTHITWLKSLFIAFTYVRCVPILYARAGIVHSFVWLDASCLHRLYIHFTHRVLGEVSNREMGFFCLLMPLSAFRCQRTPPIYMHPQGG